MPKAQSVEDLAELRHLCASGRARRIREDARLSLTETGEEIGVTPTTISRWELGLRRPRGEEADRYHRLLSPNPPIPMACLAEWLRTVIEGG